MQKQFGIVAMLDALGASKLDIKGSSEFILQKEALLDELKALDKQISELTKIPSSELHYPQMTVTTFGDTIFICWPLKDDRIEPSLIFPGIAIWLGYAVALGIKHKILLRGAISIGDYLIDDGGRSILGPPVEDAHAWYEEADWFGIILTPHCQLFLAALLETNSAVSNDMWCVKYLVPLHKEKKMLYAISWPFHFLKTVDSTGNSLGVINLSYLLTKFPIPKGTESKYENSINFFNWYIENKLPK